MSEFENHNENPEGQEEPLLVRNFDLIRSGEVVKPPLESFPTLLDSSDYREHCFEETKKAWLDQFDREELESHLKASPGKEHLRYIKHVRKFGSTLIDMYKFFDATHTPPDGLRQVNVNLGKLKDNYQSAERPEIAATVLDNMDSLEQNHEIAYANDENFHSYCEELLLEIQTYCQHDTLPEEDFHSLRKKIRQFAGLMQTAPAENLNGPPQWLFLKLDNLSYRLGQIRDSSLAKQKLTGNTPEELDIPLDASDVADFDEALPYIKKAIGL